MDKIKVLIVEDERTTRALYDKGLFDEIFDKKMVVSGKDALLAYKKWHPDMIVLDIYLPEMTGFQVLKEIRTVFADHQTTIVMATSLSGSEDVLSCMKLGIEGYIVKPFLRTEIALKLLGYYAKKEPERAEEATVLCQEVAKLSLARLMLDKDEATTEAAATDAGDEVLPAETAEAEEAGPTEVEKPPE